MSDTCHLLAHVNGVIPRQDRRENFRETLHDAIAPLARLRSEHNGIDYSSAASVTGRAESEGDIRSLRAPFWDRKQAIRIATVVMDCRTVCDRWHYLPM